MKSFILFGVVLSLFMVEGGWTQVYVCGITGDDTNTGRDHWKNAVATLQRGVDIVDLSAEGEVWVARGFTLRRAMDIPTAIQAIPLGIRVH